MDDRWAVIKSLAWAGYTGKCVFCDKYVKFPTFYNNLLIKTFFLSAFMRWSVGGKNNTDCVIPMHKFILLWKNNKQMACCKLGQIDGPALCNKAGSQQFACREFVCDTALKENMFPQWHNTM